MPGKNGVMIMPYFSPVVAGQINYDIKTAVQHYSKEMNSGDT